VVRQVEIEIEPSQIAVFLLLDFIDVKFREDHSSLFMLGMRQGQEALGPETLLFDFIGRHLGQVFPAFPLGQFHADTALQRFALGHLGVFGRVVAQIVSLLQQIHLPLVKLVLLAGQSLAGLLEGLFLDHPHEAGRGFSLIGPAILRIVFLGRDPGKGEED
jgi:hypothetical protein